MGYISKVSWIKHCKILLKYLKKIKIKKVNPANLIYSKSPTVEKAAYYFLSRRN